MATKITTATGHELYTPDEAARVLANIAAEDAVLAALVGRNFATDLMAGGKGGAPIAIEIPRTLIARSRDVDEVEANIVMDKIVEQEYTLNLARVHDYSAIPLSEADMTLNLKDFSKQVLKPQAEAIVDKLEHKVAEALLGVGVTGLVNEPSPDGGTTPATYHTYDPANPTAYFTRIRQALRRNGVSPIGLNVVVGTEVFANLLDAKAIEDVSQSGSTAALREAGIGKIRGFNIVESTRVPDTEILAFHRDAVTLATRAPVAPAGASFAANVAEKGFSLRYIRDYIADKTVDRSLVSTFSGVAILPTYKIERNYDGTYDGDGGTQSASTGTVSVTEIPNGGILHLDTADADGA